MKESMPTLPSDYEEIFYINFKKEKRLLSKVNFTAFLVVCFFFIPVLFIFPIANSFSFRNLSDCIIKLVILLLGMVVYFLFHELIHGAFIKKFSGNPPTYGFYHIHPFAGSMAYFSKRHYYIITLAPIILLGSFLVLINSLLPLSWFWPVYLIQVANLSSATGDIFITIKLRKFPETILIKDTGTSLAIYQQINS